MSRPRRSGEARPPTGPLSPWPREGLLSRYAAAAARALAVACAVAAGWACGAPRGPFVSSYEELPLGAGPPRVEGERPRVVRRFAETFGSPVSTVSLVLDEDDWELYWQLQGGEGRALAPPFEIDFSRQIAVAASAPTHVSRGGGLEITDLVVAPNGDVHISTLEVIPAMDCPEVPETALQRVVVFERPRLARSFNQLVYQARVEGRSCADGEGQ